MVLPPDSRGFPSQLEYISFLQAGRGHSMSTGYNTPYIPRIGRSIHCLSGLERSLALSLTLLPHMVDYREQYPMCDLDLIRTLFRAGKRVPRNLVPTLDGVATFERAGGELGYVGFSVKPSSQLDKPAVWRRLEREKAFCHALGWDWQLFTEQQVQPVEVANAKQLLSWANTGYADGDEIKRLAASIRKRNTGRLLDILKKSAVKADVPFCRASTVFSHAALQGELKLAPNCRVSLRSQLILA